MAQDTEGNDLNSVGIPLTGFIAVQLEGAPTFVEAATGGTEKVELPVGYVKVGLFKDDGGPQDASDKDDDIEFFQDGYKLGGKQTRTVQVTLAEFNDIVRELMAGKKPDVNGMIVVDEDNNNSFPIFTAVKFKNGVTVRRNGMGRIQKIEPDQDTRGEVKGNAVTFEWLFSDEIGGKFREWVFRPAAPKVPASPSGLGK
ncbi:major tail protein [Propionibacterium phage B3]|uniref:Major tail protein n=1 Tax=Propionibacterium phage B3 TaxID=1897533 RepID=A0A1D8ETI9_9CAUD|nr:major tail protein [Propionibacterium phage B3]AOT24306.1 major tail protein [Propionibacterium phage B3]